MILQHRSALRFTLPALLSIAPALFSAAPALAQALQCPDSLQRSQYYVTAATAADTPQVAFTGESVVLTGLAQWLEERAQAEFRLWVVDDTFERVCGSAANPAALRTYFPSACDLHDRLDTADPFQLGASYEILVTAAREDLEYVPACAIYQVGERHLPIGYLLQSVYEQYGQGEDLDRLLYGLHRHALVNSPRAGAPSTERLCRRRRDDTFTSYCGVVVPLLAYAAALESSDAAAFKTNLQLKFNDKRFDLGQINWQYDPAKAEAALARFRDYTGRIKALLKEIEASRDRPREEIVLKLLQLGELLADQLEAAFSVSQIDNADLRRNVYVLSELLRAYSAVRAREYVHAVTRVARIVSAGGPLYTCTPPALMVAGPADPDASRQAIDLCADSMDGIRDLASGSLLLASLAEAKTADEFAARLDEIASPVGAYRLKRLNPMWTLNGCPGVSYGEQELTVEGLPPITTNSAALFAPLGFARSRPWTKNGSSFGLFVSVLDVGNLVGDSEGDLRVEGATIVSDVEASFSNMFAPGAYITWSPKPLGPVTLGLGASLGTAGRKTVKFDDGSELEAEREWGWRLFFAMDVVVIPFRQR